MIVYGDSSDAIPAAVLLDRLRQRTTRAATGNTDQRRALLIEAGQLEQALADALDDDPAVERAEAVTDLAAAAWLDPAADMRPIQAALAWLDPPADRIVRVKVPEGFAFYALYPEHYAQAARRWAEDHADAVARRAVVIGVRSIGTSLSAVVARTLDKAGWLVRRLTVRPTSHPYARRVEFSGKALAALQETAFGLVVDEGPGQSGSSMAAVAEALAQTGLDHAALSFFPGHGRGPGQAGSESVRAWWLKTPCYVAELGEPVFQGKTLAEVLARHSGGSVVRMDDLSAGAWRNAAYPNERDWPAVFGTFEPTRYRMTRDDGSAVLWTFAGLAGGAEAHGSRLATLARRGWTAAPLDCTHGFVAMPWLDGEPLALARSDAAVLGQIGRYIAEAALPAVSMAERRAARERLREMLYWNTWESLGAAMAERTRQWDGLAPELSGPTHGDGWLGPPAWMRRSDGRLIKRAGGGLPDHTVVGSQPLAWDVAGALVEWHLDSRAARPLPDASPLLDAFVAAGGVLPSENVLAFYRMAYAAFRLGQCTLCAGMSDAAEQRRLRRAGEFYRTQLAHLLA